MWKELQCDDDDLPIAFVCNILRDWEKALMVRCNGANLYHKQVLFKHLCCVASVDICAWGWCCLFSSTLQRVFWAYVGKSAVLVCRYEFPEPLVFFVLNLLPDVRLKREFSKTFTRHYTRIAALLCDSAGVEQLSNRWSDHSIFP